MTLLFYISSGAIHLGQPGAGQEIITFLICKFIIIHSGVFYGAEI